MTPAARMDSMAAFVVGLRYARGQAEQDGRGEASRCRISRGGPDAVVGGDADHVDVGDVALGEPV